MPRKIYAKEFRDQAFKISYDRGNSMAETASDLSLFVNTLHSERRGAKPAC